MAESKSLMARARAWSKKNNLHGPHAFLRFVMMTFVERLNSVSDEFIFKGGNLLWLYIKTPRSTVDVDFVTKSLRTHEAVREALQAACDKNSDGIIFTIASFRETSQSEETGAAVTIRYKTEEGQENKFDLDIVYAISTATAQIAAPIHQDTLIVVASIENIVADKLAACQRFKSGNTRMKDFDDLWRIAMEDSVDEAKLRKLLETRGIGHSLDKGWLSDEMEKLWKAHQKKNADLPELRKLIAVVNKWLNGL